MKKRIIAVLLMLLLPVVLFAFLDDIISNAVGDAVGQAAKSAKNEAIKAADKDLAAVIDQQPTDITPAQAAKELTARLKKKLELKDYMIYTDDKSVTRSADVSPDDVSWNVSTVQCYLVAIGNTKSRTDKDAWESELKSMKQTTDLYNSTSMRGITDWTPYAMKPYLIMIVAPDHGGATLTADTYDKALEVLNDEFPGLQKLPGSLWLVDQ